jgi:membrane-anchored mycosin MYCP
MVSSTASHLSAGRRPGPGPGGLVRLFAGLSGALVPALVLALVLALGASPAGASAPVRAAAAACTSAPPTASVIADVPWPQARYDLAALGRISQGAGVTVAVLDSGVDIVNPQLAGQVVAGGDMLDSTGDGRTDCIGHGTAVASIIAARPMAGAGLSGLAPAARILSIRVNDRIDSGEGITGPGDLQDLVDGIREAVRRRPGVINLSISTGADNPDLRAAIQSALDADIVVVAAAGNNHDRGDPRPYPASYDGVVGVGAIGPDGQRVAKSQVGSYVDIVAPGDAVIGAAPRSGHLSYQGTSFATPFVAATAALIRARWPQLDRTEVVRRLLATADPAAGARPSPDYGYGVVNPMRALTELLPPAAGVAAITPTPVVQPGVGRLSQRPPPTILALTAAAVLMLAAAAVVTLAAAMPAGRRRRWRPGRTP